MKDILLECGKSLDYICSCIYVSNANKDAEQRDFFAKYLLKNNISKEQIRSEMSNINKGGLPKADEVIALYDRLQMNKKNTYLEEHRDEIFKKYSDEELIKDVENYKHGKGKLNKVLNHFFEECIFNCVAVRGDKSPMEALQNEKDMEYILNYVNSKSNFYTGSEVANVKSFFRNGGRIAQKVANFCPRNARDIYFRYFKDCDLSKINCLDTSMGFGSRMSSVLLSGANYCGFDPNKELFGKLVECKDFYYKHGVVNKEQKCDIYCQGSEIHKPELDNMFDVSFTSPPYFNIEKYSDDECASTQNYDNYELWIEDFVKPTIDNTCKYLKNGGYLMINIKNISRPRNNTNTPKHKLFDDWFEILSNRDDLEFVEVFDMEIGKRQCGMGGTYTMEEFNGFKEPVMVFKKVS